MTSSRKNSPFTEEEERLLKDFDKDDLQSSATLFYSNSLLVSAVPLWIFWRVHMLNVYKTLPLFFGVTLIASHFLAIAYRNNKHVLRQYLMLKRQATGFPDDFEKLYEGKKMSKREKELRIMWKRNEMAEIEATTFSIFYNNALFLILVILSSSFLLYSMSPTFNYVLSVICNAGFLAAISLRYQ